MLLKSLRMSPLPVPSTFGVVVFPLLDLEDPDVTDIVAGMGDVGEVVAGDLQAGTDDAVGEDGAVDGGQAGADDAGRCMVGGG